MPDVFLSHQPLINRQNKLLANRLSLHLLDGATTQDAAGALSALAEYWLPEGTQVFVNCGQTPCDAGLLKWPVPGNTTVEVLSAAFAGPDADAFLTALQATQPSLCLMIDDEAKAALTSGVAFRFMGFNAQRFTPTQIKTLAAQTQPYGIGIAFNVYDGKSFQNCLEAGLNAAASWFFKKPSKAPANALNPGQAQIIRVMNLVRKNADIKEIETALKQDVALSYKLLRYINSAGFGLSCEIQSFRHAVTILGYEKLSKWLSLLLATASKDPMSSALMHTALVRARLMEILGQGLVGKQENDNLFITGAFSLLEALLGVSMDKVLETMSLPESICDALLGRGGVYGPFLDLAIASEGEDGYAIADQAAMLGLSADRFNLALMQALTFAETMDF